MSLTSTQETPRAETQYISRVDNIPAATVQCHASNLLELPDRTLLCVWFGGTQEGCADISIYASRLDPEAPLWTQPVRISSDASRSEQNPILFRDPVTGAIWLFHTAQSAGNQDEAAIIARISNDQAKTWSEPFEPFPGKKGVFVRQPLVVLSGNTWVLPIFYCRAPPGFRWIGSDDVSAVMYTKDGGKTWAESSVPNSRGCVHMNIVALPANKSYVAFFRSRWADHIYRATSDDGISWTAPTKTTLPNPNSGICSATLPNGNLVIVFNDSCASASMARREGLYDDITPADDTRVNQPGVDGKTAIWGTPRKALSVGLSKDNGVTWKYRVLEDGDGFCMTNNSKERSNRELSYPSIYVDRTSESQKSVHIAYTYHRQNIKYVHISDVEAFVNESM
ncbi:hypothetical protein JX265_004751 [Neoarthrinium moseri]|uniref:Sialidase domain-containing protein n=1 Tax=Neoarthrinium moseri TaxID=1658444 RepID=A0A9P9WQ45_9PEZI|nr:uncharacterized protein JN550_003747 [Neoarthrinium moseri]KAI1846782.1 hypothetical protein JX266_007003 [Neoarthrinium moseri]KAI1872873.1 hypothetical protein JN550_003747 [Neoarthrinium moseri]KAI1874543.1 hypothetical protein JX265_004751 [Neoarthrinium moseri]